MNRPGLSRPPNVRPLLLAAVAGVGAAAMLTQLVLLRELLAAFSGNELVLGLALGNWLLLTGVGAGLGRWLPCRDKAGDATPPRGPRPPPGAEGRPDESILVGGLVALALCPLGQVLVVRLLRDVVFIRGAAVGLGSTTLASAVLLAPFCLVSGALLSFVTRLLARRGTGAPAGRVYLADSLGSLAGGVLFSFVLGHRLDHFTLLLWPAFLNLGLAVRLAFQGRQIRAGVAVLLVAAMLGCAVAWVGFDSWTTERQYSGQVVEAANSPYGRLVVTNDSGQLTFYENGSPMLSTEQSVRREETVHFALSQRPAAAHALLIGGGLSGTAREILRWGVERVTYVELDPWLLEVGRRLLPHALDEPRIKTIAGDGRRFVQRTAERFDVVILDLPDPATAQLNRYFTSEFFAEVRRVLRPDGVISFGLGRYENYVGRELAALLATGHRTLAAGFAHVQMIPGGRVYFVASDGPLTLDIAGRLEAHDLATQYVNRYSLGATLAPDRLADLERAVAAPGEMNTDLRPILFFENLVHWRSQFGSPRTTLLAGGLGAAALGFYLIRLRTLPRIVGAAGLAASGLEVVLLLAFQVLYGALYQQVGMVVTVFMAGLAGGAWSAMRVTAGAAGPALRRVCLLGLGIAALAALIPWVLPSLRPLDAAVGSQIPGHSALLGLTFGLAALVGAQFAFAGAAEAAGATNVATPLFSADLVGASLGAWSVSALLIPVYGVAAVCLGIAVLNLAAVLPALLRRPLHDRSPS